MDIPIEEVGGYDVDPLTEVSHDLYCMICLKLMRNPVQFNCGHGMCDSCFKDLLNNSRDRANTKCPQCRNVVYECQVVHNIMLHRLILALKVKCRNAEGGCEWTAELSGIEDHVKGPCQYEKIKCLNSQCEAKIERRLLHVHLPECTSKITCDNSRSMQQLQLRVSHQDNEIHSLKKQLRDKDKVQHRLGQELKTVKSEFVRLELSVSKLKNEKEGRDNQKHQYEEILKRFNELSFKQGQLEQDLNSFKDDRHQVNNNFSVFNPPQSVRTLAPEVNHQPEFDYDIDVGDNTHPKEYICHPGENFDDDMYNMPSGHQYTPPPPNSKEAAFFSAHMMCNQLEDSVRSDRNNNENNQEVYSFWQ